jgi:hypothetical protein
LISPSFFHDFLDVFGMLSGFGWIQIGYKLKSPRISGYKAKKADTFEF